MRKIILVLISLFFLTSFAQGLKGGVSKDVIPKGFYGTWGVISKLNSTNNPKIFNYESRDIWVLSGYMASNNSCVLVLENMQSGARSEISIKEKSADGKTLKFQKQKEEKEGSGYVLYIEKVEFTLLGNNFSGTDNYIVEHYDSEKNLTKKDEALYIVKGVRISGTNEIK